MIPPGSKLLTIAEFFYSKKTYTLRFKPIVDDMQQEYFEALYGKRVWKARWMYGLSHALSLGKAIMGGSRQVVLSLLVIGQGLPSRPVAVGRHQAHRRAMGGAAKAPLGRQRPGQAAAAVEVLGDVAGALPGHPSEPSYISSVSFLESRVK
jgi:hypothetical protein